MTWQVIQNREGKIRKTVALHYFLEEYFILDNG